MEPATCFKRLIMHNRLYSTTHFITYVSLALALCCTMTLSGVSGVDFLSMTPFRGDEIDGRDFDYGTEYFLDVFSYRPSYTAEEKWEKSAIKYRGIAGSVKSDEFWTDHRFHFAYDLADWLRFSSQALEREDFEGRYSRFELGFDAEVLPRVSFGLYGEVLPEKGDNDFGMRLSYRSFFGQVITVGFEAPDVVMGEKGENLNE